MIREGLILEVELKGLAEILQGLLHALALARDFDFQAARDVPGRFLSDGGGESHGQESTPVGRVRGFLQSALEPGWEPFAVDSCGRLWTSVEVKAFRFGLCGRLWTPVDAVRRSTDQKVGGSSPSGRATEPLLRRRFLSSPAEFDSPCAFVGQGRGREVSRPDVIESSDERVDVGGE